MPNPWDAGTTKYLASLGFPALATTSAGAAHSLGRADGRVSVDEMLDNISTIAKATDLPINADFEHGYSKDVAEMVHNIGRCIETGVAGLSIEDSTGDRAKPLFDLDVAVQRMVAARAAIDASGKPVVLTGRAECFLVGHSDPLPEAISRLRAYSEAGADCLYAPGIRTPEQIRAVVEAVAPKPVNVLVHTDFGLTVRDLEALGVRRISLGSAVARVAWTALATASELLAKQGSFAGFVTENPPNLNTLFSQA